jgi:hypothetical protein
VKFKKRKYYFMINTEKSGPDLGLTTGDLNVKTFDLVTQFLSPPSPYAILIWAASFYLFNIVLWNITDS